MAMLRLRSRVLGWLLVLALAGCDLPVDSVHQVTVLGGEITVKAPQFYCVSEQSSRSSADTAVVLIGRCAENGSVAAAVLTVTIGRFASGGVMLAGAEKLREFLRSPAGRKALARTGRAGDVAVLQSGVVDGTLMLHLNDRVAGEYWRAIIGIKGRLVTISASGAGGSPLVPQDGQRLVEETVAALIRANPATKAP